MESQNQTIINIIEESYIEIQSYLSMQFLREEWCEVILFRDWSNIKKLEIVNCQITENSILVLLKKNWPLITHLNLNENKLNALAMKKLTENNWPQLEQLKLNDNLIQNQGLQAVLHKFSNQLITLCLNKCGITGNGIISFINQCPNKLKWLNLSNNLIGNIGMKLFVKSDIFFLQQLWMWGCRIESQGFKHLAKAKCPNLVQMFLGFTSIQNSNKLQLNGLQMFNFYQFKNLQFFEIPQTQSICWLNSVFICNKGVKINQYKIDMKNQQLLGSIQKIIRSLNN